MSKAYDRVNICMLQHAMNRIKLPQLFIRFITNLFTNRTNQIFTPFGLTDPYNLLVGIDQGEVICPLLWCIYYDPLLAHIQNHTTLGYEINTNNFLNVGEMINNTPNGTLSERVPDTAFIDDTTWIAKSVEDLQSILTIANSFCILNDILINDDKATLLTNNKDCAGKQVTRRFNSTLSVIKTEPMQQATRILGVWISMITSKTVVTDQLKEEINKDCNYLWSKKVTDKQMLYIFNTVIVPRLEFKSQLTFISESMIHYITEPFRILFKHKLSMNKCSPNALLTNPLIYNYRDLYDAQIQAKVSNLETQLNDTSIVGRTTAIRIRNLQYKYCLHKSPLEEWPFDKAHDFKDHIADLLCVLPDVSITFQVHERSPYTYNIKGGNVPLHSILPHSIYLKHIESIRNSCSYFRDQLVSPDGLYLVKWGDRRLHQHIRNKKPRWFTELEKKLLADANSSRRIHIQYQAGIVPPSPSAEITFTGHFHHNSWTYSWLVAHNCVAIGQSIKSLNDYIIIEHWSPSLAIDNDVSPSAASLTIKKCHGCHLNNTATIDPRYLPKNYVPKCLISVEKRVVLKLLLVKKIGDTASVGFSHFILEQTARHRCFTNTPVPDITPPIIPPTRSSPNHQLIDTFIMSSYHVPILRQLSTSLSDTLSPIYYTDGSVNTSQITAGAAWIETSRNIHLSFHTNLPHDWMTSFKSELIAIILTLIVTRETSHVTIYTDSKSVIDKFNALNSEVNRFSSSRHNTKLQYFKYWALLFHLIETLQLKVQFKKVKAHRGNKFNEEVDKLAKAALFLNESLVFNTDSFANVGINFKHIEIEDSIRGFVKI